MEAVKELVEKGADVSKATNNGYTPLYMASQQGHEEVVRVLVEKGADINRIPGALCWRSRKCFITEK